MNMSYFVQIGLTLVGIWFIIKRVNRKKKTINKLVYSQSGIHELIKDLIPKNLPNKTKTKVSQSRKHIEKNMLRVIMVEGKAYWVMDNVFYVSDTMDGDPDTETAQPVDTSNMSKQEVEKMLFILDSLKRGKNHDSGSTGNE